MKGEAQEHFENEYKPPETTLEIHVSLLKAQRLIAHLDSIVERMSHDMVRYEQWQCDYAAWFKEVDDELQKILENLK